ncbi:MAG: hypothetical protein LBQ87_07525, partial [Candidatus Fibromonas sp.]|nr:hypothetical protein [Candidatus Fibromonas sp.]
SIRIRFPNKRVVIYKVPVFKVLEHSISELEGMALLLPFYILKIRKELRRKSMDSEKRKALSKELESYVIEIDKILKRCKENSYITSRDAAMLFRRLLNMNMELYGQYPEFKEVDMTLKDLADTDIDEAIDKAVAKAESRAERRGMKQGISQGVAIGMEKVFALLEKGMSLAEAKKKLHVCQG